MKYIKIKLPEKSFTMSQSHVHEIQGSVKFDDLSSSSHNHRFVTITEEATPVGLNDHVHEVVFRTDFINGHYHEYHGRTFGAIPVGDRHVHFLEGVTSTNNNHNHKFRFVTLIDNSIE
ncbi:MAG: hypothetical protein K0S41_1081 [Anaerocolumna sp.]|jgi:hypothetical protein|nr:hypothetical protein [Anaerocolumna sp.]